MADPILQLLSAMGGDPVNADGIRRYLKDVMPAAGRPNGGYIYDGGPFALNDEDVLSWVYTSGSPLTQWLPYRLVDYRYQHVQHLEWIAPKDFDGTVSYADWLKTIDIDECGYGPATSWSGFQWQCTGGTFSFSTDMMKRYQDGGIKYYEQMPMYTVRGTPGIQLASDVDWAIARLFIMAQQHYNFVVRSGNLANSAMEWDGLDTVVRSGYVQARKMGSGVVHWADPIEINGAAYTSAAQVLEALRRAVRRVRRRARARGWGIVPGDQVVLMAGAMWDNLAEAIAQGAMWRFTNNTNVKIELSYAEFRNSVKEIKTGGMGFGTLDVDGEPVPVLVDDDMGLNITIDPDGTPIPGVMSDIFVLTRRAGGNLLLEQQLLNWDAITSPAPEARDTLVPLGQGNARAGWVTESNKCFYYYLEMGGQLVTYGNPFQARINGAAIPTVDANEIESGSFTSPHFYPYGTSMGGAGGSPLLHPVG